MNLRSGLMFLLLVFVVSFGARTARALTQPVGGEWKPVSYDKATGLVTLDFIMRPALLTCTTVVAEVIVGDKVVNMGRQSWEQNVVFPETDQPHYIEPEKRPSFTQRLVFKLPLQDTSFATVRFTCGDMASEGWLYFVTSPDSIEYWLGYPEKLYRPRAPGEPRIHEKLPRDTMQVPRSYTMRLPDSVIQRYVDSAAKGRLITDLGVNLPAGWPEYIVVSSQPGTSEVDPAFVGETSYIDVAIANYGPDHAGGYTVSLYDVKRTGSFSTIWEQHYAGLQCFDVNYIQDVSYVWPDTVGRKVRVWVRQDGVPNDGWPPNDEATTGFITPQQGTIKIEGYIRYNEKNTPGVPQPARNVTLLLCDADDYWLDEVLDTARTDDNGYYEFDPVVNEEAYPGPLQDIYVRVYPEDREEDAAFVTQHVGDSLYYVETATVDEHPSGTFTKNITVTTDASGPFYVVDVLRAGREEWLSLGGSDPGPVQVAGQCGCSSDGSHYLDGSHMYIEATAIPASGGPDTWDDYVILHEYGHFLEHRFGFFDDSPGGAHTWGRTYAPAKSASEGMAHFLAALLLHSPVLYDRWGNNLQYWSSVDLETGLGRDYLSSECLHFGNQGFREEASVAGFLWDMVDQPDDDFHTWMSFPTTNPCTARPDGAGDSSSVNESTMLWALLDGDLGGANPADLPELETVWFLDPPYSTALDFYCAWYEHGCQCCTGSMGNIDLSLDGLVTMGDLTVIVDHLFISLRPLVCLRPCDIDGSGGSLPLQTDITMGDLTIMIDKLFINPGPWPSCPDPYWNSKTAAPSVAASE